MKTHNSKYTKKDEIIDVAKKLFYLNGISATSFEQIAKESDITAPLITYHFQTKNNLAKAVMENISINNKNSISEKIYNTGMTYDLKISTVVEIRAMIMLTDKDPHYRNFFLEFMNCGFETSFLNCNIDFYKIHDRQYHLNIDRTKDELSLLSIASCFSSFSLIYAYYTDRLSCSLDQLMEYVIYLQFRLMHVSEEEIDRILCEGKKVFEQLDLKVEPYFQII